MCKNWSEEDEIYAIIENQYQDAVKSLLKCYEKCGPICKGLCKDDCQDNPHS